MEDAGGKYPELCKMITSLKDSGEAYRIMLLDLKEAIRRTVSNIAGIDIDRIEAGISPSIGTYRVGNCNSKRFRWEINDEVGEPFGYYRSIAYLHVIRSLPADSTDINIIVDLTHGINYTSTALYRVALDIARLYSAANLVDVMVEVFNSEPYIPGTEELKAWRIRKLKVTPKAAASRLVYTSIAYERKPPSRPSDALRVSGDLEDRAKKELHMKLPNEPKIMQYGLFEAPLIGGFPLLLLQAGANHGEPASGYTMVLIPGSRR